MKLQKNQTYSINFIPDGTDTMELGYQGTGVFTGKQLTDSDGNLLFWFENLTLKKGFTEGGWFSLDDINPTESYE